jgi:GT2 family glycosyltransferase
LVPETARQNVSIIICAYTTRRAPTLRAAVAAVRAQLRAGDELLVVVDHNPELLDLARRELVEGGTADAAPQAAIRVIANENRRGLSGARNAGVEVARNPLVAFLDDDAVPRPGWLSSLTEPFRELEVVGVGGVAAPAWESERPAWLPEEFLWVVGCSYRGLPLHAAEIRNPIGANMAFRRDVIRQVAGFTDGIGRVGRTPLGCEETELSIRATRATGGRIVHQPAAVVDHLVPAERARVGYFIRRCWAEGLSKAVVSRLMGGDAALASERRYTTRTLPWGVLTGVRDALAGDQAGLRRAAAIAGGLAVTVAGYLRGLAERTKRIPVGPPAPSRSERDFTPVWAGELDLAAPVLPVRITDEDGTPYERARILIRAAGTPLGFLQLDTPAGNVDLARAVDLARDEFAAASEAATADAEWTADTERRVSVVLCTHNRPDGARRTLESLLALRHRDVEIIVVDNAPVDDSTREMVAELMERDSRMRYVLEPRKGLSRARNRGLQEATGEVVAFTDDDVLVDQLWVHGLLRGFASDPAVACVTGLVASASLSRPAEQYFDNRVWWSSSCAPRLFSSRRTEQDSPLHPYMAGIFGTGANFAATAAVLRAIGGFDESLGAGSPTRGGEDLDAFVRLVSAGHSLSYQPSALVWHEHRVDDASLRSQMYAYGLGLTAYLTKYLLARESRGELVRRLPGGLWHAVRLLRRSRRAVDAASLEGSNMTSVELRGMLAGPWAYVGARRAQSDEHVRAVAPVRSAE